MDGQGDGHTGQTVQRASRVSSSWRTSSSKRKSESQRTSSVARPHEKASASARNNDVGKAPTNGKTETPATRSASKWIILAGIVIACVCAAPFIPFQSTVYCDKGIESAECIKCPDNGKCSEGVLTCDATYVKQPSGSGIGEVCILDEAAVRRARDLLRKLSGMLKERYGMVDCGANPELADGPASDLTVESAARILSTGYLPRVEGSPVTAEQLVSSLRLDEVPGLWFVKRDEDAALILERQELNNPVSLKEHGLMVVQTAGAGVRLLAQEPNLPFTCKVRRVQHYIAACGVFILWIIFLIKKSQKKRRVRTLCQTIIEDRTRLDASSGVVYGTAPALIQSVLKEQMATKASLSLVETVCEELAAAKGGYGVQSTQFYGEAGKSYWSSRVANKQRSAQQHQVSAAAAAAGEDEEEESGDDVGVYRGDTADFTDAEEKDEEDTPPPPPAPKLASLAERRAAFKAAKPEAAEGESYVVGI